MLQLIVITCWWEGAAWPWGWHVALRRRIGPGTRARAARRALSTGHSAPAASNWKDTYADTVLNIRSRIKTVKCKSMQCSRLVLSGASPRFLKCNMTRIIIHKYWVRLPTVLNIISAGIAINKARDLPKIFWYVDNANNKLIYVT